VTHNTTTAPATPYKASASGAGGATAGGGAGPLSSSSSSSSSTPFSPLVGEPGGGPTELWRGITPFRRRQGKWLTDATPFFPLVNVGGTCEFHVQTGGNSWVVSASLRFFAPLSTAAAAISMAPPSEPSAAAAETAAAAAKAAEETAAATGKGAETATTAQLRGGFESGEGDIAGEGVNSGPPSLLPLSSVALAFPNSDDHFDGPDYNENRTLVVAVPAGCTRVEVAALITGHGSCEFQPTSHHFMVGLGQEQQERGRGQRHLLGGRQKQQQQWQSPPAGRQQAPATSPAFSPALPSARYSSALSAGATLVDFNTSSSEDYFNRFMLAGSPLGCTLQVPLGSLPNEHGTWYYGRNGWCDGQDVKPLVWDITDALLSLAAHKKVDKDENDNQGSEDGDSGGVGGGSDNREAFPASLPLTNQTETRRQRLRRRKQKSGGREELGVFLLPELFEVTYKAFSYLVGGDVPSEKGCDGHIIMTSRVTFY